jgi:gentisate 1,2-dioxygenase
MTVYQEPKMRHASQSYDRSFQIAETPLWKVILAMWPERFPSPDPQRPRCVLWSYSQVRPLVQPLCAQGPVVSELFGRLVALSKALHQVVPKVIWGASVAHQEHARRP